MSVSTTYLSTASCGFCGLWRTVWVMATTEALDLAEPFIPTDTFAVRLAILRAALGGWNVKRAADACGINDQSWRNWEAGVSKPRDMEGVCRQIARSTGVNLAWLMLGGELAKISCLSPFALLSEGVARELSPSAA